MIPVEKPTDNVILKVLEGFLDRTYSRDDVYVWQKEMREHYAEYHPGCMKILAESKSGNFIVQSLAFINDKGIVKYENSDEYFIRDEDIQEFIFELKSIDCTEQNGNIKRLRAHQVTPIKEMDYPLVCISCADGEVIKIFGVFFTRGIVDDLAEHTEYADVEYNGAYFYLQYSHRPKEHQFTIFGIKKSDSQLSNMLFDLDIKFENLSFVNDHALVGSTELWRQDDNGNAFLVSDLGFELEAELCKRKFEEKGHKQIYFLKSKSA